MVYAFDRATGEARFVVLNTDSLVEAARLCIKHGIRREEIVLTTRCPAIDFTRLAYAIAS